MGGFIGYHEYHDFKQYTQFMVVVCFTITMTDFCHQLSNIKPSIHQAQTMN